VYTHVEKEGEREEGRERERGRQEEYVPAHALRSTSEGGWD